MQERTRSIDDILAEQAKERRFWPMPLEVDLFLKRVAQGGDSGFFLGKAFLSAYSLDEAFDEPLSRFMKLDAEGQRLFHQIIHIRLIPGWSDSEYYDIAKKTKKLLAFAAQDC